MLKCFIDNPVQLVPVDKQKNAMIKQGRAQEN